jgi:hypothetical protein
MQNQNAIYLELSVEAENGSVYVHSKHVPGLHLMGPNFQTLKPTVEMAIKQLFKDNQQMMVNVIWLTEFGVDAVCNVLERLAVIPVEPSIAAA